MAWNWLSNRVPGYQSIGQRQGLQFFETDIDKVIFTEHKHFNLFKQGVGKKIKYILEGSKMQGEFLRIFEYSYTISTGKTSHTYTQHVYSVRLSRSLPAFVIKPQNFFHKIGKWFGMQDIEFNDFEDFNKHYLVKSKDESAFRYIFNQQILGFMSYEEGWVIDCSENLIIYFKPSKRMNEEMIEPFIQVAATMHNLLTGQQQIDT